MQFWSAAAHVIHCAHASTVHVSTVHVSTVHVSQVCEMLLDEADGYNSSGLPASRPNSMNKYGLVLNEIGLESLFDSLLHRYFPNP